MLKSVPTSVSHKKYIAVLTADVFRDLGINMGVTNPSAPPAQSLCPPYAPISYMPSPPQMPYPNPYVPPLGGSPFGERAPNKALGLLAALPAGMKMQQRNFEGAINRAAQLLKTYYQASDRIQALSGIKSPLNVTDNPRGKQNVVTLYVPVSSQTEQTVAPHIQAAALRGDTVTVPPALEAAIDYKVRKCVNEMTNEQARRQQLEEAHAVRHRAMDGLMRLPSQVRNGHVVINQIVADRAGVPVV